MSMHGLKTAGLVLMMLAAPPLMAVQPQGAAGGAGPGGAESQTRQDGKVGLSLQFRGGTLAEYVRAVEQAGRGPEPVNIVVSGPAEQVRLAPIAVREVDVATALRLAVNMSRTQEGILVNYEELAGAFAPVHHVSVIMHPRPIASRVRQETEVFSLRELLRAEMPPQTVLSAVEAALRVDEEAAEPVLRFHEPSGLLIVRGSAPQVRTVAQVVAQLTATAQEMHRERQRREINAAIEERRQQHAELEEEIARLTPGPRPGQTPAEAIQQHEENMAQTHVLRSRHERLQQEIRRLETQRAALSEAVRIAQLEDENARLRAEIAELRTLVTGPPRR
jgi:type II secretory pathway component GspD/PulD (secretin)